MKFYTWSQRLDFLDMLNAAVRAEFPDVDSYNIFVFGSFLRDDYDSERSDLDLAIYAAETEQTFAIHDFLKQYLEDRQIPSSLLEIFLDQLDAYVVVNPLGLNVAFTDYYPEELKIYFRTVQRRAIFYNKEAEAIEGVRKAMGV